jgi:hypothetical protein
MFTVNDLLVIARPRTFPSTRNLVQSRTDWAGIRWRPSGRGRRDHPGRLGPTEELVLEYCPQWWDNFV